MSVYIGTASWTDPGFIADWYPPKTKRDQLLPWYAQHFDMVEVNSSFYGLPVQATIQKWASQTPTGFVFNIKLPKLFSWHRQEFAALPNEVKSFARADSRGYVERTDALVDALASHAVQTLQPLADQNKMGLLLLQLSPSFDPERRALRDLLPILHSFPYPVAVEFRNHGWLLDQQLDRTLDFLSGAGAVFVNLDAPTGPHFTMMPKVSAVTNSRAAYIRAHGRNASAYLHGRTVGERFDYEYTEQELLEIQQRVTELNKDAGTVHVVFNNNRSNYAPRAAEQLKHIMA